MTANMRTSHAPDAPVHARGQVSPIERTEAGPRRVLLVGAGRIADTHAQALSEVSGATAGAIVDPAGDRAEKLAAKWKIGAHYTDLDIALAESGCTAAHVLVPPPLHRPIAERCLAAGLDVLVEKPLAETDEDCAAIQRAAQAARRSVHVNQNAAFLPAQQKLETWAKTGELGRLRHVACHFAMPLAQMQLRQFGHWMFREPANLLLEQAVHPLSQIDALVGPAEELAVSKPPATRIDGLDIHNRWMVALECERGTAELLVSLGGSYPVWQMTALFDDGVVIADYHNDRVTRQGTSRFMGPVATFRSGLSAGFSSIGQANRNLARYALSTLGLVSRSDPFYLGMKASIAAFHDRLTEESPHAPLTADQGRRLVSLCRRIAQEAGVDKAPAAKTLSAHDGATADTLVIGGTGFIGRPLVRALLDKGERVAVMARNTANLPDMFHEEGVQVIRGDATDPGDLASAIAGCRRVVNLAHGGGAQSWEEIEAAIVGGARSVAEACLEAGTERLIYVSTIASLYCGDAGETITCETPPDPKSHRRGDYSRAKAEAEREMMRMAEENGLPVTIMRPGVVLGEGSSPFHSGFGLYNSEPHCLGWNRGHNDLPLVLAEDTADAIMLALDAPQAAGKAYNIVGDVRLSAREYTDLLGRALGRKLRFHPQSVIAQQAVELSKWTIKRVGGRRTPVPGVADLKSRGLVARFDTSDIKRDLGWQPVADRDEFLRKAIDVHRTG